MRFESKRAKEIYETFCKLHARHIAKKRGTIVCCDSSSACESEEAVHGFYSAVLDARNDLSATEEIILSALRDLTMRESQALGECLKQYCLDNQLVDA